MKSATGKLLLIVLALFCTLALFSCDVIDEILNQRPVGQSDGSDGLEYRLSGDGKSYLVSGIGDCKDSVITIPSQYNEKPVTGICHYALSECDSVVEVRIPAETTYIGNAPFIGSASLVDIVVNENNPNYKSIDGCLYTKDGKTLIQYPIGRKSMSFEVPDGVTTINDFAFSCARLLTNITLPRSVASIEKMAFCNCDSLYKITNNSSIELDIGTDDNGMIARNAKVIENANGEKVYRSFCGISCVETADNFLFDVEDDEYTLIAYVGNKAEITLPEDVYGNTYTMKRFRGGVNVIIPDALTEISTEAFAGSALLSSVTLGRGVTLIYEYAFRGCDNLTDFYVLNLESWLKVMLRYVMENNMTVHLLNDNREEITDLVIPEETLYIRDCAFAGCKALKSITIPSSVAQIGGYAFSACTSLESVYYLGQIENWCTINFHNIYSNPCNSGADLYIGGELLSELYVPDTVRYIREYAFARCKSLTSVTLPDSLKYISCYAFADCTSLKKVTAGSKITSIGESAFDGCISLASINIPDSVSVIEDNAFYGCSSLKNITVPKDIVSIGEYAFAGCWSLYKVINRSSLDLEFESFDNGQIARYAKCIEDSNGNKTYKTGENGSTYIETDDNFWFEIIDGNYTLIAYGGEETDITLPEDIDGNSYDIYEFEGGINVIVPGSLTKIGKNAFRKSETLKSVIVGNGVTSIVHDAFESCVSLESITIPQSVTYIGAFVFLRCSSLTEIRYEGTMEQWDAIDKKPNWDYDTVDYVIYCTDGEIVK